MSFKRHFARVDAAERCNRPTETGERLRARLPTRRRRRKKERTTATRRTPSPLQRPATQGGDVTVHLHPHSQLERAVRHERQAQAVEPPTSASPAAPPAPAAAPPAAEPVSAKTYAAAAYPHPQGATAGGQAAAPAGPAAAARVPPPPSGGGVVPSSPLLRAPFSFFRAWSLLVRVGCRRSRAIFCRTLLRRALQI